MKRLVIVFFILILSTAPGVSFAQDDGGVSEEFYASLSPYGTWIQLDNGLTVWRPVNMQRDWSPYRYGHWIWTNDGWYWDSDEPFGSIVYHYGRWYDDDYYGWIWVPDNVWAPAWVEWRYNDDYIGWAPLAPYADFSIGVGISFSTSFITPISYWHFVGYHHMCDPYVYHYYIPDHERYRIYSDTRYRTNYGYSNGHVINRGVDVDFVRQRGGGRITERRIQAVSDPRSAGGRGNDNVVRAFMPSREQLVRTENRNVEIKRATRPSSLDISKVSIGGSRNAVARENRNNPSAIREPNRIDNRMPGREVQRENPGVLRENNRQQGRVSNNQPGRMIRPQVRQENMPQQRVQRQPQVRQESRPQQRVQSRPQVRQEIRPQPRVQSRPQVRQEIRPQPRVQNNVQRRESPPQVKREKR
jgi:hypothetical protein